MGNILLFFTCFSVAAAAASSSIPTANGLSANNGYPGWFSATDIDLLGSSINPNITVSQDGSGDYRTITQALEASVSMRGGVSSRFFIHVKEGVYKENVKIKNSMKKLMLFGDGIDVTIITGDKYKTDRVSTFDTSTVAVIGVGFIARDMTFENTAGPQKHQAVALRSDSDMSFFYRCSFKGYQDTLYVTHKRQFYHTCDIYGTVDFIFGNAAVVFDNCTIFLRRPMSHQKNTVTAQASDSPSEKTGILIQNSRITASPELKPVQDSIKSYLGRPWRQYSRTVIMRTMIDGVIDPLGWLSWKGDLGLSTVYYVECFNVGPGAETRNRVKWGGYHVITSPTEASKFSFENFFGWE